MTPPDPAAPTRPRITSVRIRNYKSIRDATLDLAPFTVLIGQNGSGKSNVVDALACVADIAEVGRDKAVAKHGGTGAIRNVRDGDGVSTEVIATWEWDHTTRGEPPTLAVPIILAGEGEPYDPLMTVCPVDASSVREVSTPYGTRNLDVTYASALSEVRVYPASLSVPCAPVAHADSAPQLHEDLSNLAAILWRISRDPRRWGYITHCLSMIAPSITFFEVRSVEGYYFPKFRVTGCGDAEFNGTQLSLGTRRTLAVLAAAFQRDDTRPEQPRIVAIEEPELGLFPEAAMTLAACLSIASNDRQILVTTHSPDVLDLPGLDLEAVRIAVMVDGETKIGRIAPLCLEWFASGNIAPGQLLRDGGLIVEGEGIPELTSIVTR